MIDQQQIASRDAVAKEIPLTEQDKENFLKAVLSDEQYVDTIELFGGKHKLTFTALTVEQNEDVLNQVKLDQKNGKAENTDSYFITLASYRLAVSLTAVDGKPFAPEIDEDTKSTESETYISLKTAVVKKWKAFKLSAYLDVFDQFENKIVRLGKEIQSENFWKASV